MEKRGEGKGGKEPNKGWEGPVVRVRNMDRSVTLSKRVNT